MKRYLVLLVAIIGVGCDPGERLLKVCEEAVAALPAAPPEEGETLSTTPWDEAEEKCEALADSDSEIADTALRPLETIRDSLAEQKDILLKRKWAREHEERVSAKRSKIVNCDSGRWVSVCELNRRSTGGAFYADSPDECAHKVSEFRSIGAKCMQCGCTDDFVAVMNRELC